MFSSPNASVFILFLHNPDNSPHFQVLSRLCSNPTGPWCEIFPNLGKEEDAGSQTGHKRFRASLPQRRQRRQRRRRRRRSRDAAFPTQCNPPSTDRSAALTFVCQRFALGMADGERSPLLSDLGDGALGSGNGGLSPGAAPYGVPNKPQSEYPWCSLLHPTPA